MTVVGLHPEELFDKEARGEITASERARLASHVEQCAVCRAERQMRLDFADEMADDGTRISVSGLLAFAKVDKRGETLAASDEARAPSTAPLSMRALKPARRPMVKSTWLLVAAALFAVSVAGASGVGQRAWSKIVEVEAAVTAVATGASPVAVRPAAKRVSHLASIAPPTAPMNAVAPTVDVLAPSLPVAKSSSVHSHRSALAGAPALFELATDARRHGDYARALALHRELEARFPASREAHVARATTGRLLLDLGDPASALASYDEYLASGSGELGEETMVGRATALERLGRADDARRAWQSLLAAYPESPYAAHAMRRLGSPSVH